MYGIVSFYECEIIDAVQELLNFSTFVLLYNNLYKMLSVISYIRCDLFVLLYLLRCS